MYESMQPIGFVDGEPVYSMFGADVTTAVLTDWIPEEWGGEVVGKVADTSAVWAVGRHEPMSSTTKHVPRSGGVGIQATGKGGTYTASTRTNDDVELKARKLTGAVSLAEEDIEDAATYVRVVDSKKMDWARDFAVGFDNATLGVTGAESATMSDGRPFTSVYNLVRTTNASLGYTADDNYNSHNFSTAASGSYAALNAAAKDYEDGPYFSQEDTVVIASPAFKSKLRGIVDTTGQPIFKETAGVDPVTKRPVPTLFDYPVRWAQGAKKTATMTDQPAAAAKPLLIFANARHLIVGDRKAPESQLIPPGVSKEDEAFLKMRARVGFAGGHPAAFSVLEDLS